MKKENVRYNDVKENAIEWYTGNDTMTITLTQRRLINKVLKLAEKYPKEVEVVSNTSDCLCAHLPLRYLTLRRPKEVSEEQRERMRNMAKEMRG